MPGRVGLCPEPPVVAIEREVRAHHEHEPRHGPSCEDEPRERRRPLGDPPCGEPDQRQRENRVADVDRLVNERVLVQMYLDPTAHVWTKDRVVVRWDKKHPGPPGVSDRLGERMTQARRMLRPGLRRHDQEGREQNHGHEQRDRRPRGGEPDEPPDGRPRELVRSTRAERETYSVHGDHDQREPGEEPGVVIRGRGHERERAAYEHRLTEAWTAQADEQRQQEQRQPLDRSQRSVLHPLREVERREREGEAGHGGGQRAAGQVTGQRVHRAACEHEA